MDLDACGRRVAPGDGALLAAVGSPEREGQAAYDQDKGSDLPWRQCQEGGGPKVCQGQM